MTQLDCPAGVLGKGIDMTTQEKLAALRNYGTKYEIALKLLSDGREFRVCYSGRKSRSGLLSAVQAAGPDILRVTSMPDDARMEWKDGAMKLGTVATIRFTGRTQRDAICSGELPRVRAA